MNISRQYKKAVNADYFDKAAAKEFSRMSSSFTSGLETLILHVLYFNDRGGIRRQIPEGSNP